MVSTCVEKEAYLTRDQTELAARGVTTAKIAAMETKRVAFVALPSRATESETSSIGFQDRNTQATVLLGAIRLVMYIAEDTFPKNSSQYKSFNAKGLSKMNANQLSNICPNIVAKGTQYMSLMGPKGLTAAMLTNITTQAATLLPLISNTPILVGDEDAATVVRRNAANDLFVTMKGLCHTGYVFYLAAGNDTKAKEYVVGDGDSKVVDRDGIVKPLKKATRKTADITATTPIRFKVKTGTSLQVYYGMTKTSAPTASAATVLYNPNIFLSTTAADLGYDLAGGIKYFIIYNPNADDAEFLAKIG